MNVLISGLLKTPHFLPDNGLIFLGEEGVNQKIFHGIFQD